jgi:hypothetical protein
MPFGLRSATSYFQCMMDFEISKAGLHKIVRGCGELNETKSLASLRSIVYRGKCFDAPGPQKTFCCC